MRSAPHLVQVAWGKQVRDARQQLGLNQVVAAERIGIDQSTLSRIERGDYRRMNPEMILRLCLGLCMPPEAFAWPPAIIEIARLNAEAAA